MNTASLASLVSFLLDHCRDAGWSGWEPYDRLNSRLFHYLPLLRNKPFRLLFCQGMKRNPLNLRPVFGVPAGQNPKGVAFFVSVIVRLSGLRMADLAEARALDYTLIERRCPERDCFSADLVREYFCTPSSTLQISMRINAGPIPNDHWIQDPEVGGGRLVGEGCHFVDLAIALGGSVIHAIHAAAIPNKGTPPARWDNFSLHLELENGALATIVYTSVGDPALAKERIEVHGGGRSAIIEDFHSVELWHGRKCRRERFTRQNKGQEAEVQAWASALRNGTAPSPWCEIESTHRACFIAYASMQSGNRTLLSQPESGS